LNNNYCLCVIAVDGAFAIGKIDSNFILVSSMPQVVLPCTSQPLSEAVVASTVEETADGHNLLQVTVSCHWYCCKVHITSSVEHRL